MGKASPIIARPVLIYAFFIVMKRPSYRERTCLLSRAYERFTVVKIREYQISACNNGVQGFKSGTLCSENSRERVGE